MEYTGLKGHGPTAGNGRRPAPPLCGKHRCFCACARPLCCVSEPHRVLSTAFAIRGLLSNHLTVYGFCPRHLTQMTNAILSGLWVLPSCRHATSLQTPWGPGGGPRPPKYFTRTCHFWHLKDLEVVPTPKMWSWILFQLWREMVWEESHKTKIQLLFHNVCLYSFTTTSVNDATLDTHTFWYKGLAENK